MKPPNGRPRVVWVDVTRTSQSSRVTGVERATHEIASQLLATCRNSRSLHLRFFRMTAGGSALRVPDEWISSPVKGTQANPEHVTFQAADAILALDLSLPPLGLNLHEVLWLKTQRVRVFTVVYDVLPLTHPKFFPDGKRRVFHEWLRATDRSDGLIFISETSRRAYQKVVGPGSSSSRQPSLVIRLGPLEKWLSEESQPRRHRLQTRPFSVLVVGTIEPRKDISGVIDAAEILWRAGLKFKLTIFGRKGWKSEPLVERLTNHPLYGRSLFWRTDASDAELIQAYRDGDCLVANSVAEGFGLPLVEAAAVGLPVAARDIEVFRETLPTATFYAGGDPKELATTIAKILYGEAEPSSNRTRANMGSWADCAATILAFIKD